MAKKKDFVSDGLVTLRHKYVDEQLKALRGDDDVSSAYKVDNIDKTLSVQEQQMQIYYQTRRDLDIGVNQQLTLVSKRIVDGKREQAECEDAGKKLEKLKNILSDLPSSIDFEDKSESLKQLEYLRVEFHKIKAACFVSPDKYSAPANNGSAPKPNSSPLSLLPELNSLSQMQMFKMGFFFALPLILGIIVGCGIIAWIVLLTMGG